VASAGPPARRTSIISVRRTASTPAPRKNSLRPSPDRAVKTIRSSARQGRRAIIGMPLIPRRLVAMSVPLAFPKSGTSLLSPGTAPLHRCGCASQALPLFSSASRSQDWRHPARHPTTLALRAGSAVTIVESRASPLNAGAGSPEGDSAPTRKHWRRVKRNIRETVESESHSTSSKG
jgi:hypothetical protein